MVEKLKEGIVRVCIPFENIYTSSFILIENNDAVILDSGNSDEDAIEYIIPEIEKLKVRVKYLVSSHTHQDHHGGINALKKAFPDAIPTLFSKNVEDSHHLNDGEVLLNRFKMLNLKGHTEDSLAVLDIKTNTLLSCDSLQSYGVGRFKTLVEDTEKYFDSIKRVRALNLDTIIASHEYEPLGSIIEKKKIPEFLEHCKNAKNRP